MKYLLIVLIVQSIGVIVGWNLRGYILPVIEKDLMLKVPSTVYIPPAKETKYHFNINLKLKEVNND